MKRIITLVLIAVIAFLVYNKFFKTKKPAAPAPVAIKVGLHSATFNNAVQSVLNSYYNMAGAFTAWDSSAATTAATTLTGALNNLPLEELKSDTAIYATVLQPVADARQNVQAITAGSDWGQRREALQQLTENLRTFLLTVKYDKEKIYYQECPMAFGEGRSGNWLSRDTAIKNPYLGSRHPQYGSSMLQCGETKTIIDFVPKAVNGQ